MNVFGCFVIFVFILLVLCCGALLFGFCGLYCGWLGSVLLFIVFCLVWLFWFALCVWFACCLGFAFLVACCETCVLLLVSCVVYFAVDVGLVFV